jgi:RNA polymerase sigma factor (sigma-70 family)
LIAGIFWLDHNWAMSDVTRILSQIESGDPQAAQQLLPLVYDELRKLAAAKLVHEKPGQTLQATALVHEAYLRLVGNQEPADRGQGPGTRNQGSSQSNLAPGSWQLAPGSWNSRGHFFAAAAEAMRRILVEQARRKQALRRGGDWQRQDLDAVQLAAPAPPAELLALDEALTALANKDAVKAELVKLRYFAGLTMEEAATALGISPATAHRYWNYARAWLHQEIAGSPAAMKKSGS